MKAQSVLYNYVKLNLSFTTSFGKSPHMDSPPKMKKSCSPTQSIYRCYNRFNAFPCVFLIVQIRLKMFFYINFVYFFSKGLILSFYDFCILNEVQF